MSTFEFDPDALSFSLVRKGYNPDEVRQTFRRLNSELKAADSDREAAATHAGSLAAQLEDARDELDALRKDVDRMSVPPTTADGMSDRITRMLRLASEEAFEVRAQAEAEAAKLRSMADQEAAELRGKYEALLSEAEDKRAALELEVKQTLTDARAEKESIIESAKAEAARLAKEAEAKRKSTQQDFETAMDNRRAKATKSIEDLEASSRAEAEQRLEEATDKAGRMIDEAAENAAGKIAHAKELAEEMRGLRSGMLAQLLEIREQLDAAPAMLAAVEREADLLGDAPAPVKPTGRRTPIVIDTTDDVLDGMVVTVTAESPARVGD